MTGASGDGGLQPPFPEPAPRRPARLKPVMAGLSVASPLVLLVVLNVAVLVWAYVEPTSTCWLKSQIEAGRRVVYPFEIHLLYFTATIQFWAPVLLLVAALFWYVDWVRVRELLLVAVLSALVLYLVGFEYGWMNELYRGRYDLACG
ncbi:MAG: hypothetical protein RLO51_08170 [Thalassobaculum sp.]|uniref:hypothetical protein n=1 Tax=Thalassobaculum sp. TaxID=2022740 RepID=UPI0032EAECEB